MAFISETQPGKMRHTFTGIKTVFANYMIHKIINEAIRPFRVELMRRTESGGETQITESLKTYILDNLEYLRKQIQKYAFTAVPDINVTLAARKTKRDNYINLVLNKDNTAEIQARKVEFTHSDELLEAGDAAYWSITWDYTSKFDKDMGQPTPERVQNDLLRELVVALDKLVVAMTRSHSSDNPRTILAQEAALWISDVDLIYEAAMNYHPGTAPFHPTAWSLNERETFFNSDGSFDVDVTEGENVDEKTTTTRRGPQPSGENALS